MAVELQEEYDKIYKYCYFKVHNKEIAEDLTQETFLSYFKQTSYIDRGKQLAYLYRIAKNKCIDYYKRKKTDSLEDKEISFESIPRVETNLVLQEALLQLPEELQELILLRYVNELQVGELAKIYEVSRFVIYRKQKEALNKLKEILGEEPFYE